MAVITDAQIDEAVKSSGPFNPALNKTQGIQLRQLLKDFRDGLLEEINDHAGTPGPSGPAGEPGPQGPPGPAGPGGTGKVSFNFYQTVI